ncbi:MAG: hypothetical protein JWO18_2786 [Microbacteriaceae bacterium]|nr:hypothetical protein [Microbacteriaceae bacterium]
MTAHVFPRTRVTCPRRESQRLFEGSSLVRRTEGATAVSLRRSRNHQPSYRIDHKRASFLARFRALQIELWCEVVPGHRDSADKNEEFGRAIAARQDAGGLRVGDRVKLTVIGIDDCLKRRPVRTFQLVPVRQTQSSGLVLVRVEQTPCIGGKISDLELNRVDERHDVCAEDGVEQFVFVSEVPVDHRFVSACILGYPINAGARDAETGEFSCRCLKNASPRCGRIPLVLLCHGSSLWDG